MAEIATYIGVEPRTVQNGGSAIARGLRCTLQSTGLVAVQDNTARGDFVTAHDIAAHEAGEAFSMQGGGKVPAVASEATLVGDPAYTATAGRFSKTTTSNVLVGRWTQPASGAGVLGEVELLNPL